MRAETLTNKSHEGRTMDEHTARTEAGIPEPAPQLDSQLAELFETVWACEQAERRETRLDAVIRYSESSYLGTRRDECGRRRGSH
jgi:hypothetical protein